jgi:hypothetical protein
LNVQAIAIPHGAALAWIRLGRALDEALVHRPGEVVVCIESIATGFRVETENATTAAVGCYDVPSYFVSRVESLNGDLVPRSEWHRPYEAR